MNLEYYKQQLLSNWNIMRVVKLFLSFVILFQSVQQHDMMFGFLGGVFLTQTLLNMGCCGVGSCAVPLKKVNTENVHDIEFEEIKEIKK